MQLNRIDNNVSFGRVGFADKAVKKAFYEAFDKPRFTHRYSENRNFMYCLGRFLMEKENTRHDRLLKIGMTQVKGKDYFTNANTGEILGTSKRGRQNICLFLMDLIEPKKKMSEKIYGELYTSKK